MQDFQSLGLSQALLNSLSHMGYNVPTPIQAKTIPLSLSGKDVLGTAQTGTGKTAAYAIPLVSHLMESPTSSALVLTPTRELAMQVIKLIETMLGKKNSIRTALLIGGDPIARQIQQLHSKPRIIVGTPGRINDHLNKGTLKLDTTNFLVLDETDRMLDLGFGIQLEEINKFLPKQRQTLMFSATLPNNIQSLAAKYLKNEERVSIGSTVAAAETIRQEIIRTTESDKHQVLLTQLDLQSGTCVIFVARKAMAEKLAGKLNQAGHTADAIHGDLRQRVREKVLRSFRNQKYRILVATDVAARGLDIPHIECVVNYDLPQCEEDFIHRIGRTGRAGNKGSAVSLITPQDHQKWNNICKMMNPNAALDPSFAEPRGGKSKPRGRSFGGDRSGSSFGRRDDSRPAFGNRRGDDSPRSPFGERRRDDSRSAFGDRRRDNSASSDFGNRSERSPRSTFGERRRDDSARPAFGDRRECGASRLDFGGERKSSRPAFGSNRSERSSRSSFGSERGERSSRPAFGGDRRDGGSSRREGSGGNKFGNKSRKFA